MYSKINVYKQQAEIYIQQAKDDAVNWANVLGATAPSTESIDNAFNEIFVEIYNPTSLSTDFLPFSTAQELKLILSDYPVRKYKLLADSYKHPYTYPNEIQQLYDNLQIAINSITTTSNNAISYTRNKLDTTIKTKLTDIKNITKTEYTLSLSTKTHLNNLLTKLYYSNSDYKDAIRYSKFLKSAYLLYPTLKQKILDVYNADLNAEEDGATPPSTGWGGLLNLSGSITSVSQLENFRLKIVTSSDISKLGLAYGIYFYKPGNPVIEYRSSKRYLIDEIGDKYFILNTKETILEDVTPTEYLWSFQVLGNDVGSPGISGWSLFNETYYARQRLQKYVSDNGVNYGTQSC
jgi:hypothetical protein